MLNSNPCIFCGRNFEFRQDGGDHIIPSGLGKFLPNHKIKDVCIPCDNHHGSTFEMIGMRTGMIGAFRRVSDIKSGYRKNKQPHNPSNNSDKSVEASRFSIETADSEKKTIYITDKGEFRTQNEIISYENGEIVSQIEIPHHLTTAQACDFVCRKMVELDSKGFKSQLKLCSESDKAFLEELARRKIIDLSNYSTRDETTDGAILIKSIITRNHFRFAASIIAKAMYFSGKSRSEISSILQFVHEDNLGGVIELSADNPRQSIGFIGKASRKEFAYKFLWIYSRDEIILKANFLASLGSDGIDMLMRFDLSHGENSIANDFGVIVAKYTADSVGQLEIFRNERKIE